MKKYQLYQYFFIFIFIVILFFSYYRESKKKEETNGLSNYGVINGKIEIDYQIKSIHINPF